MLELAILLLILSVEITSELLDPLLLQHHLSFSSKGRKLLELLQLVLVQVRVFVKVL